MGDDVCGFLCSQIYLVAITYAVLKSTQFSCLFKTFLAVISQPNLKKQS